MKAILRLLLPAILALSGVRATAQEVEVPYWASIRVSEVNMRVGPAESYRIAWVYKRKQLPLKVVRTMEGWRLVEDPDGERGWLLGRFLSRDRSAIVVGDAPAALREKPNSTASLRWRIAPGVVGMLGDCVEGWCGFDVAGRSGFVRQDSLWGAGEP